MGTISEEDEEWEREWEDDEDDEEWDDDWDEDEVDVMRHEVVAGDEDED